MKSVELDGITKSYPVDDGELHVLGPIDLRIEPGEFLGIVGPSGCGKTTLLRLVAGLGTPTQGRITVDGEPVSGPSAERTVVFQAFALFPSMTVLENVAFGLRVAGVRKAERHRRAREQLELVGLAAFESSYPNQLSGGMQQRVALARALVIKPEILLLDEPFGALDAQTRTVMQDDLADICGEAGVTTLLITHSVEEAVFLSDRIMVMTSRPGTAKEIIDNPLAADWKRRGIDAVANDPEFTEQKEKTWKLVKQEINLVSRRTR